MSKYQITHSCGHNRELQLYGKMEDRENKCKWLENQECPSCWGKSKREEDSKLPITATLSLSPFTPSQEHPEILCEISLTGGTFPRKEEIKSMGYQFREIEGGVMDFLFLSTPPLGWCKKVPLHSLKDPGSIENQHLKTLGAICVSKINPLDLSMVSKNLQEYQEKKHQIEALGPTPTMPAFHPSHKGRWNGKIYSQGRVYIDKKEYTLSEEEIHSIRTYQENISAYYAQVKAIQSSNGISTSKKEESTRCTTPSMDVLR